MMTTETQIPQARLIIGCGRELGGQFLLRRKNPLDFKDFPVYMAFDPLRPHKGVWPHRRDFLKPSVPSSVRGRRQPAVPRAFEKGAFPVFKDYS
jgi:hypothetical protein